MADRIEPRSGVAFKLRKGQTLKVIDPTGEQVSDLLAFSAEDPSEQISSGRSIDYASRIFLTTGDALYSNRSRILLRIIEDTVGRHDFLLTPCSADTFRIIYGDAHPHHGCQGNFEKALEPYGISGDQIPVAFNIFMNVALDGSTGEIRVLPPRSKAGDYIVFIAEKDLIISLTACSAPQSNNGSFKHIDFEISGVAD
jgi:uncharacterized protein YcgI (DUF1989 family)